jgi:hypothetical protein
MRNSSPSHASACDPSVVAEKDVPFGRGIRVMHAPSAIALG